MSNNFKIGDRVERLCGSNYSMDSGDRGVITGFSPEGTCADVRLCETGEIVPRNLLTKLVNLSPQYKETTYQTEREQTMYKAFQKLTARLSRVLNKNLKAIYKMGWINGDLKVTHEGRDEILEMLVDLHEKELGERAIARIEEIEKEDK